MTEEQKDVIREQAAALTEHLQSDIAQAMTRVEHQRLTQRAFEAAQLLATLESYSHNADTI